jgi:hypothetical protein
VSANPGGPERGSAPASSWARKTVLLVDVDGRSREARAQVLRTLGAEVHSAASAQEARLQLNAGSYSIVLLDFGGDRAGAEKFAGEIQERKPAQLVALLVGSPNFVAKPFRKAEPRPVAAAPRPPEAAGAAPELDFGERIRAAEAAQTAGEAEAQKRR